MHYIIYIKIKNKVNLLSDSLRKTLDMQTKLEEPSVPVSSNVQLIFQMIIVFWKYMH